MKIIMQGVETGDRLATPLQTIGVGVVEGGGVVGVVEG